MGKGVNDPCRGGVILFMLKNQKNRTEKIQFLDDTIQQCANKKIKNMQKTGKAPKIKKKRSMNGWNCYLKKCSELKGMDFPTCMKDKKRKNKEYVPKKDEWNKRAKEGCN